MAEFDKGSSGVLGSPGVEGDVGSGTPRYEFDTGSSSTNVFDPSAEAFLLANGSASPSIVTGTNNFVSGLKRAGLWPLLDAIWPMVGGTAAAHKFNLKDPRDADAAYRLTFTGSWTHGATGAAPDGATAYADTFYNPSTKFSNVAGFMAFYSRSPQDIGGPPNFFDMGNAAAAVANATALTCRYWNNATYAVFGTNTFATSWTAATGAGLFTAVRDATPTTKGYRNGVQGMSGADVVTYQNSNMYLGAMNEAGVPAYFSSRECAFAALGPSPLDAAQNLALYNLVQQFQVTLGRNV